MMTWQTEHTVTACLFGSTVQLVVFASAMSVLLNNMALLIRLQGQ